MQVKTFSVYKDVPVQIKVTQERFYDHKQTVALSENTTIHVVLTPYAGLSAELLTDGIVPTVSVSAGELPDYTDFDGTSGVLRTFGKSFWAEDGTKYQGLLAPKLTDTGAETRYNLFYKDGSIMFDTAETCEGRLWVGAVTIPAHTVAKMYVKNYTEAGTLTYALPLISGFSQTSWITSSKALPNRSYFPTDVRFITRIQTDVVNAVQEILFDESDNNHGVAINSDGRWRYWKGSAVYSTVKAVENTSYWVQYIEGRDNVSRLYVMVDDGTYQTIDALPNVSSSSWTLAIQDVNILDNAGAKIRIGNGYKTLTEYFRGKVDLSATRVDIGNRVIDAEKGDAVAWSEYWRPLA